MPKFRERFFWSFDRLTGGTVGNVFQALAKFDGADSNSDELANHQNQSLHQLLNHAAKTTDYYRSAGAGLSLIDFPVVDKNIIRINQGKFLSNVYNKDRLFRMSTSGSTGSPFLCFQDINKKKRVNAEVIFYNAKVGYSVGQSIIFLRAVVNKNRKTKLDQWMQNIIQIDVGQLDDPSIERLLSKIEKISKAGSLLLAYASTFDILQDYLWRKGTDNKFNIFGMVSISEMLFDDTRASMMKVFKCKCVSRYSNQENGVLGQDDSENNYFNLNEAHYIFEVLKINSNEPVGFGETGRIVITDLFNFAMPMIRYDTGDVGAVNFINRRGIRKKVITNFGGRKIDMVYDSDGNLLSPHKISVAFWDFPELKQFQFVQKGKKEYLVNLNVHGAFVREKELKRKLIKLLGEKAELEFEYSESIPVLDSGKRKYIQNDTFKSRGV